MVIWLRYVYNSAVVEVTMTIVAALGAFIVGNEMLGVSGVLAVLCLGIWMLSFGAHHISREVQEPLNIIWYVSCRLLQFSKSFRVHFQLTPRS